MRRVCEQRPPGVVTYQDGVPVGWCSIGPRAEIPRLASSRLMLPIDDVPASRLPRLIMRRHTGG